jgi:hypothetical protein
MLAGIFGTFLISEWEPATAMYYFFIIILPSCFVSGDIIQSPYSYIMDDLKLLSFRTKIVDGIWNENPEMM